MAVTALAACSDPAPRGDRAPHVILIIADTLRADHLGCYGYGSDTSPNIDRFAKEGLLFERCLSHAPDTRLSCAALLSGFLPHETSILDQGELPEAVRTLPELLHARGYATAAVIRTMCYATARATSRDSRSLTTRWSNAKGFASAGRNVSPSKRLTGPSSCSKRREIARFSCGCTIRIPTDRTHLRRTSCEGRHPVPAARWASALPSAGREAYRPISG